MKWSEMTYEQKIFWLTQQLSISREYAVQMIKEEKL